MFAKKVAFLMRILVRKCKKRKKVKKPLRFIWKIIKKSDFVLKTNAFLKKSTRNHGTPGFSGIFDFAVCGGVLCRFAYDRGLFSVIFLHFLQKYRCVPKIGFPADIFLSFSFIFFRSIVVYLKLGSRLTFVCHLPSFSSEVSLCT